VTVTPTLARSELNAIAEEIISILSSDPQASIRVSVEISAEFPDGASDSIKRAVTANASSLDFQSSVWE
jgi:hypothetical protein